VSLREPGDWGETADARSAVRLGYLYRYSRPEGPDVYACICFAVTESEVCHAAAQHQVHGDAVDHVSDVTHAGTGCGSCVERLRDLVAEVTAPVRAA
jgi:bacterioferritin-associated ferredoxin